MTPGIHLVHKPAGPTSFSLVQRALQCALQTPGCRPRRICHGGTLDPFARGLLLILVEPATRLFDYLHNVPKTYEATVHWGIETDNGDPLGRVSFQGDPSGLSPRRLQEVLASFIGWHLQIPPATSAKRIDGERAYAKAHRGENVVLPPCHVYLHEAHWTGHDLPRTSQLRLTVKGGFYVRSLVRDIGRQLACGAPLSARQIIPWTPVRLLSDQEIGDLRRKTGIPLGQLISPDWPLPAGFPAADTPIRGFHMDRLCCLLTPVNGLLKLLTFLGPAL
jgi:tRNA pseudouridine55 synthase